MRKIIEKCKKNIFPIHWMLPVLFTFCFNNLIYFGVRPLVKDFHHYNISGPLDALVPFMPEFMIVYMGCYIFWVINYCMIAKQEKEKRYRFFTADFYARLVCLAFFVLLPTTNTRPVLSGDSIWIAAVRWLYDTDAPNNLLPSIHCMASWFSYIGIRGNKKIPHWYRRFSCIFAFVVFLSTLALRQHVLIDVFAGVALAEITYYISMRTNGYRVYERICERVGNKIMGWLKGGEHGKQEENGI